MKEKGLTTEEVEKLKYIYGLNELTEKKKESLLLKIFHVMLEPMFLLLIIAASVYFILGEPRDGIIMLIFVVGIISIDIFQEIKTDKTINALKELSEPTIKVLRDGEKKTIPSSDLVPGDIVYIHEGIKIPADGYVVECSGLKVDESSLTGESVGVWKTENEENNDDYWKKNYCYQGTLVVQGTGIIKVDKTGINTEYGKIGKNIIETTKDKTPLQKQTDLLVKICAVLALVLFIAVMLITFINLSEIPLKNRIIESILSGVTLAMALIPEEFPVILTVFLSMGAWRLAKKNSLVKKLPSVETLGAISILCIDKTGTITKNKMQVSEVISTYPQTHISKLMCLCCEDETYDPMEHAMFDYAKKNKVYKKDLTNKEKIKDYPFSNETKIMGKSWNIDNEILLCAKGSPENILKITNLSKKEIEEAQNKIDELQNKGLRVIALASKKYEDKSLLEDNLMDAKLDLMALIALIDPPRETVKDDIELCYRAGIRVIMITGDNGLTASAIAKSVNMRDTDKIITGEMIDKLNDKELSKAIKDITIASRVTPEHKMRIVKALQKNGEIVAMTGDGVNDAPALKQANIGIALGKRGSEVSREAADLILLDDNFTTITDTIRDGRRIYDNIQKSLAYIFIIHIPIAFSSLLAPLLKISLSNLMLLPLHIVLLELLIDPTCSVVLERIPEEKNIMTRPPRNITKNIMSKSILFKSIIQGLVIFLVSFLTYYFNLDKSIELARTMSLLIIMISNIFLVQVNSSDSEYAIKSIKNLFKDKLLIIINLVMIIAIYLITYTKLNIILKLTALSVKELSIVVLLSFVSTYWIEIIKVYKNIRENILKK